MIRNPAFLQSWLRRPRIALRAYLLSPWTAVLVAALLLAGWVVQKQLGWGTGQVTSVRPLLPGRSPADLTAPALTKALAENVVAPLSPEAAVGANEALPFSNEPIKAPTPFRFAEPKGADFQRAFNCLSAAIYYEGAGEPLEGQKAIAQVVLNRVRHPAYPNSVCGVVLQGSERVTGCQFTFTCDGSLGRVVNAAAWSRAESIARAALNGEVYAGVGWATHYHTKWVLPLWAPSLAKIALKGAHIFYRWGDAKGQRFTQRYGGLEPEPLLLRMSGARKFMGVELLTVSPVDLGDVGPGTRAPDGPRLGDAEVRPSLAADRNSSTLHADLAEPSVPRPGGARTARPVPDRQEVASSPCSLGGPLASIKKSDFGSAQSAVGKVGNRC